MLLTDRRALLAGAGVLAALPSLSLGADKTSADFEDLTPRQRIPFDGDWRFSLGHASDVNRDYGFGRDQKTFAKQGAGVADAAARDFDDSTWQVVNLPHDWALDLPFVKNEYFIPPKDADDGDPAAGHGYKAIGRKFPENSIGWYRKVFRLNKEDADKRLTLEFDGVFRDAVVIFNGYVLTRNESGYAPFSVDISNFIDTVDGLNVLLVRADASLGEGWFYEGAGIYRHVWLVKQNRVHIPQWGVFVRGTASGEVFIDTRAANVSDTARRLTLVSTIFDAQGRPVAQSSQALDLPARRDGLCNQTTKIAVPHLWGLDDPHLYTLRSELRDNDQIVDVALTRFGLRDIRFDAKTGFYLNGQWLKLHGANNHQDHAGVGVAIPDDLHEWRVRQLKDMGANIWRCSHNPPAPELLEACDRLGMLVIDETRLMTSTPEGLSQLETLIVRDRNHPSIILWSIGNEETAQQGTERGLKIALDMRRTVKALDPTRPITAAMNHYQGYGITPALDVMGFNYHEKDIEPFRALYPDMPIIGTETASAVSTRGEYVRDERKGYVRSYDLDAPSYALTAEAWWTLYNSKPYLSGGLVWTGFDYRGEPTPFNRFPEISSHFGILDTCGFAKDIYYYYKAWWQAQPVLHLFPHWNWEGSEGKAIPVWVHSNLDAVELFVNGKSFGRKNVVKDRHMEWSVPYQPGQIVAFGYKGDKVVMKSVRKTAGEVARLALSAEWASPRVGHDVALFKVEAFDRDGTPVPRASNLVEFSVDGPGRIIGVGNGNPTSLEPDRAKQRHLFNGLAQVIVQGVPASTGPIVLSASTEGLVSQRLRLSR